MTSADAGGAEAGRPRWSVQIVSPADRAPDSLEQRLVVLPDPAPGEVRVAVRAVGVNPADYKSLERSWPRGAAVPVGFEASGVVTGLGSDIAALGSVAIGDEVIAYPVIGSYATDLVVPLDVLTPKPAAVTFAQAANLLLAGCTAAEMVHVTRPAAGETVLVHGGSAATGTSLVQQLRLLDVEVIATGSERSFPLLKSLGAMPVAYGDGLFERVTALAPSGVAAAFDCAGTAEAARVSIELTADRSRIVSIVDAAAAATRGIRFLDGRDPASYAWRNQQRRHLAGLAAEGRLTVPMARTFTLDKAEKAFTLLRSGHPGGKVALIPDHGPAAGPGVPS